MTSPGLLFRAVQARRGLDDASTAVLTSALPPERARPMVAVLDGHPHTLALLASVHGVPGSHLGVTRSGQSADLESVHRSDGLDADSIVGAALDLVDQPASAAGTDGSSRATSSPARRCSSPGWASVSRWARRPRRTGCRRGGRARPPGEPVVAAWCREAASNGSSVAIAAAATSAARSTCSGSPR